MPVKWDNIRPITLQFERPPAPDLFGRVDRALRYLRVLSALVAGLALTQALLSVLLFIVIRGL